MTARDLERRLENLEQDRPPVKQFDTTPLTVEEKQVLDDFFSVDKAGMYSPPDPKTRELFDQFNENE